MVYKSLNGLVPEYLSSKFVKRNETYYSLRDSVNKIIVPFPRSSFLEQPCSVISERLKSRPHVYIYVRKRNTRLSTLIWTAQLVNAYVYACSVVNSLQFWFPGGFLLFFSYAFATFLSFTIVYVWIGIDDMSGDHRLRVDRNSVHVYERKHVDGGLNL